MLLLWQLNLQQTPDIRVSWIAFDPGSPPIDVRVSWVQFDALGTSPKVKVWSGSQWVPATLKVWRGTEWDTPLTKHRSDTAWL
jgi:hypothetical protein